ncbi:uncharacterized protein LOC130963012 [Arachis stenosperma]|uniref:uncharacterized protein LOC130963012 n=1 Tax=Arachis stenosperma TaxID=217475 RepID=UPI0025AC2A2D|nr:uncharacterized protein LOC130963012 [Arachis stenosperma]
MADHESKFNGLVRQVERTARIVDYEEGQNTDEFLARLRANHGGERYQVTRIVEEALNRVGQNVGFMNRPHFVSTFPQTVQMAEVPRGVKNPKIITKFAGEVRESTTEHVARYLVEIENLTNDENSKIKFFPSSLTKNAFTWFSNLRPNLITTWNQLETAFHTQFYRGKMNVSVTDLVALKYEDGETIDDYMIRFKNARSRCYVSLPESKVVKIATMGLGFYMHQKLLNVHIPDLAHLAEKIFDVLLKDKQLVLPKGRTLLSVKDLKGKPYCKFHQAISHSTNSCVHFRDLIQEAIMEGRLKFDDGKRR